jgi:two-component system, LytTR family, sensor histidine kinase AlgZ
MAMNQQQARSFLPDFCSIRMLFVVVLLGELLAIFLTLTPSAQVQDRTTDLALYSLFIQWIVLSCTAALCLSRNYLNGLSDSWAASLSYLLTLLIALLITELAWWIFHVGSVPVSSTLTGHDTFLFQSMGISAIVSALSLRYFYIQHQWRKNIESEAEAKVQALQFRIRPHFFFNCMNTIASLTRKDPVLAEEATEDLADLFRVSLQEAKRMSTVAEEISLCKRYLRIESHRFGDRLETVWETGDLPENAQLPTLTLQPILENAIYHGIERLPKGGVIHIRGQIAPNQITITIDNPLPPSETVDHHHGNQMAQDNIRQRLSAYYGDKAVLITESDNQRYITKVIVPYPYENTNR